MSWSRGPIETLKTSCKIDPKTQRQPVKGRAVMWSPGFGVFECFAFEYQNNMQALTWSGWNESVGDLFYVRMGDLILIFCLSWEKQDCNNYLHNEIIFFPFVFSVVMQTTLLSQTYHNLRDLIFHYIAHTIM